MSWYITGTGPHYWDGKFSENINDCKIFNINDVAPIFIFSSVGPFWTLPEAKKWVYGKRIEWIENRVHKLFQSEDLYIKARKNLGHYSLKKALLELQIKNPELKI